CPSSFGRDRFTNRACLRGAQPAVKRPAAGQTAPMSRIATRRQGGVVEAARGGLDPAAPARLDDPTVRGRRHRQPAPVRPGAPCPRPRLRSGPALHPVRQAARPRRARPLPRAGQAAAGRRAGRVPGRQPGVLVAAARGRPAGPHPAARHRGRGRGRARVGRRPRRAALRGRHRHRRRPDRAGAGARAAGGARDRDRRLGRGAGGGAAQRRAARPGGPGRAPRGGSSGRAPRHRPLRRHRVEPAVRAARRDREARRGGAARAALGARRRRGRPRRDPAPGGRGRGAPGGRRAPRDRARLRSGRGGEGADGGRRLHRRRDPPGHGRPAASHVRPPLTSAGARGGAAAPPVGHGAAVDPSGPPKADRHPPGPRNRLRDCCRDDRPVLPKESLASPPTRAGEGGPAGPSEGARAGRGVLYIAFAKFYFMVAGAVLELRLPTVLGNVVYGSYGVVNSLVSPFNNVLVTGTIQTVSRFTSQRPEAARAVQRAGLRLHLYVGLVLANLFAAAAPLTARFFHDADKTGPLMVAAAIIAAYSFYAVFVGTANGRREFHKQAGLDVGFATLRVAGILGMAMAGFGLMGAIGGWAAAAWAILLVSTAVVGLPRRAAADAGPSVSLRPMVGFFVSVSVYLILLNF